MPLTAVFCLVAFGVHDYRVGLLPDRMQAEVAVAGWNETIKIATAELYKADKLGFYTQVTEAEKTANEMTGTQLLETVRSCVDKFPHYFTG